MPFAKWASVRRAVLMLFVVGVTIVAPSSGAFAAKGAAGFKELLEPAERAVFETVLAAKAQHETKVTSYWKRVTEKRALRRGKKARGETLVIADYVKTFPPTYAGPELPAALAKRWAAFQEAEDKAEAKPPRDELPGLQDFLTRAKDVYDFVPEVIAEQEFKLRYAREALSLGLTKEQVLRVYALETSGLGTADMISGIHPIKKTGKPISSAIGYAQLLTANTTDELVKAGPRFVARLATMAAQSGISPERRQMLLEKKERLSRMIAAARSIPHEWSRHVAFARTERGQGIHAINMDGDIGPWLQVIKLAGIKKMAEDAGMMSLSGAQLELMNLAGPGTGLEMMLPVAAEVPTPNFFERGGYARNTIVRDKTSSALLAAIDKRMDQNITNVGAIEFAAAFDKAAQEMGR